MSYPALAKVNDTFAKPPVKQAIYIEHSVANFYSESGRDEYTHLILENKLMVSYTEIHSLNGLVGWKVTAFKKVI